MSSRAVSRTWKAFVREERTGIERAVAAGHRPGCPRCGAPLAARPGTRLAPTLPTDARGHDLECRSCRRFHARVLDTPRSLYVRRLRWLAAAVLRA